MIALATRLPMTPLNGTIIAHCLDHEETQLKLQDKPTE